MKICVGSDHAGYELKEFLATYIESLGHEVVNVGTYDKSSCDYPVYGEKVGRSVASGESDLGIAVCGTGCGIGIAAGRVPGIRCCNCSEPFTARRSREHNNCNVLSIGARVIGPELAQMIVYEFLTATFEGERHARRVNMLDEIK